MSRTSTETVDNAHNNSEERPVRRQTSNASVFRCLFPANWDESQTSADDSQPQSSDVDEGNESLNTLPPARVSQVSSISEVSPSTESDVTSVCPTPDDPAVVLCNPAESPADSVVTPGPAEPSASVAVEPSVSVAVEPSASVVAEPSASVVTPSDPTAVSAAERTNVTDTPDVSPSVDNSSSSQAREVDDMSDDPDNMEHDEYLAHTVSKSDTRRIVRGTSNPVIWRHQRRPKTSICVFDAADDGVCLAQTGLIWSVDGKLYEVVLVASLGWSEQRNSRSHNVNYSNPIYIILRSATLQGRAIKFSQLHRVVASTLFREGRPHHSVHFPTISFAVNQAKAFVDKHQRALDKWSGIAYLKTESQKLKQRLEAEKMQRMKDAEMARKLKLRQQREASLRKKRELAELKRAEQQARKQAELAARRTAKAEQQKRARQISRQVKAAVLNVCKNLESEMEKTVQQAVSDVRVEIEEDIANATSDVRGKIEEDIANAISDVRGKFDKGLLKAVSGVRGEIHDDYGVRLVEVEASVETLKQSWEKHKTSTAKKFKEINKQLKKLKQQDECENEAPPPRKRVKQFVWQDVDSPRTAMESTVTHPQVQTMPMTMQALRQPVMTTPVMYQHQQPTMMGTPRPQPATSTHNTNLCRYISPIFGQRNYNIRNI